MGVVSLKVVIAGRTYPVNVSEAEQAKVLKAADDINDNLYATSAR